MFKKIFVFFLFSIFCNQLCAQSYLVRLGNERVLIQREYTRPGPVFVHLHQNEKTALMAARTVMRTSGGCLLTLQHQGGRNIVFYLDQKRYEFDPNRIFTEKGIVQTLRQYGHYSKRAHEQVRGLATRIKRLIPEGRVIAVHNNQSYSLKNYQPGESLASEARELYLKQGQSYRNFFLVTKKQDFLRLKERRYNSVLQKTHPTDDGSLSVYLANRAYINVEAGHHQLESQIRMLHEIV